MDVDITAPGRAACKDPAEYRRRLCLAIELGTGDVDTGEMLEALGLTKADRLAMIAIPGASYDAFKLTRGEVATRAGVSPAAAKLIEAVMNDRPSTGITREQVLAALRA